MERLSRQPSAGMTLWQKALSYMTGRSKLRTVEPCGTGETYSGVAVNEASVLALSAAWACVNLLAGTIASLPLMIYRRDASGSLVVARDHPLYRVIHDSPNFDQTAMDFWEGGIAALELRGNMHARIERLGGRVVSLVPIYEPTVHRMADGSIRYRWSENGRAFDEPQENVFHVRGFGGSPLGGMSPLAAGRQIFGLSSAINTAAQTTFANGMRPTVAVKFDKFLEKPAYDLVQTDMQDRYAGAMNNGRAFIAHGGMDIVPLTMNPEDAQMLESRSFSVEEIARLFGVPPHMIGHTEKATSWGTGLEQQTLGFQKFTLRRRLKRIEQAIEKQLLTSADRAAGVTVEFNLEGLLRGDSAARFGAYQTGLQNGIYTINEVREIEGLAPVAGGDVPRMQTQNQPITATVTPPALPSPVP